MKIALCSDLHLEFGDLDLKNDENADVLILSGDILIADVLHRFAPVGPTVGPESKQYALSVRFRDFLKNCSDRFSQVVYVAGNHEFYHGKWNQSLQTLRDECAQYPNINFLENNVFIQDDITFIGGTLWTDLNGMDPLTEYHLQQCMNDYRQITHDRLDGEYSRLIPANTYFRHKRTLEYISTFVEGKHDQKFVVVGHHCPSKKSTKPGYENDYLINGGYSSNLEEFIMDRPQIKAWTHGHTHEPFDYMIGETRILCNPRGYAGYESTADNFKLKYFEV